MVPKHPRGRPLLFKSPEELQKKIDAYFHECEIRTRKIVTKSGDVVDVSDPRPLTLSGLAVALDCDRLTLLRYSARDKFCSTISRARERCEAYAHESLWIPGIGRGVAFSLQNNHEGWSERHEHSGPGGGPVALDHGKLSDDELNSRILGMLGRAGVKPNERPDRPEGRKPARRARGKRKTLRPAHRKAPA